jgi:hypothetical protein
MFPTTPDTRTAPPSWRDRLRQAADIARAFVLLEDPIWEDDLEAHGPLGEPAGHPHREPLRPTLRARRPGAATPRPQDCLVPLRPAGTTPGRHQRPAHHG